MHTLYFFQQMKAFEWKTKTCSRDKSEYFVSSMYLRSSNILEVFNKDRKVDNLVPEKSRMGMAVIGPR